MDVYNKANSSQCQDEIPFSLFQAEIFPSAALITTRLSILIAMHISWMLKYRGCSDIILGLTYRLFYNMGFPESLYRFIQYLDFGSEEMMQVSPNVDRESITCVC